LCTAGRLLGEQVLHGDAEGAGALRMDWM
jgi:hypothetical protein